MLTVSVGACSSRADYNPFSVDPEAIADRVRSVVLAPLAAGPEVGAPESTLVTLERAITDTLTAAGFAVVSLWSESDLLKDTKRLHRAVGIVLGPLVEQTVTKRAES